MSGIVLAGGLVIKDEPVIAQPEDAEGDVTFKISSDDKHRGQNKSGRAWKAVRKEKASMAILKPLKKTLGLSWEKKQQDKIRMQETKELQNEILAKKKAKSQDDAKKRAAKLKRKAENELKNAKVQVLSHPEKMKNMSKKQLRSVYKTRMGEDGVVRLVGAYE